MTKRFIGQNVIAKEEMVAADASKTALTDMETRIVEHFAEKAFDFLRDEYKMRDALIRFNTYLSICDTLRISAPNQAVTLVDLMLTETGFEDIAEEIRIACQNNEAAVMTFDSKFKELSQKHFAEYLITLDGEDEREKVRDDEDMLNLMNSIQENGVLTPVTVRKIPGGTFEMISGHRRKRACELLGMVTIRGEVVNLDRDEAIIMMCDSNLQRTTILPSEKAKAYKMRLDAMNRQGKRTDLTCTTSLYKSQKSVEILGDSVGESRETIRKYIRLNELIPEILDMVDEGKIALRPAVEISYVPVKLQEECYVLAEQFLEKLEKKKSGIPMDITIPQLVREKLDSDFAKNFTGEQGYHRNLQTLKIIEKHPIAGLPVAEINPYQIECFLQGLTSYSDNTIKKVYQMIRQAFRKAKNWGVIQSDPLELYDFRRPRSAKSTKEVKGFTEDEQVRFEKALNVQNMHFRGGDYRLQMLMELYSGMRMGEINGLKPEDIDFDRNVIHVSRTVSEGLGGKIFLSDTTKTDNGVRDVPICEQLGRLLKVALRRMKDNPEGLVFYDHEKGCIIATRYVNLQFKSILKAAEIPVRGQHSLRHTFATRCIESGIQPVVLKKWMGHSDIHITLDTYADVFSRMNNDAIMKFSEHLRNMSDSEDS